MIYNQAFFLREVWETYRGFHVCDPWVKLCQEERSVVWMEKYQPDEPKKH